MSPASRGCGLQLPGCTLLLSLRAIFPSNFLRIIPYKFGIEEAEAGMLMRWEYGAIGGLNLAFVGG